MSAQNQSSKLEATASILDNLKTIILTLIGLAIFIALIFAFINSQNKSDDSSMSIEEAQKKCVVITLVGYQKAGEEMSIDEAQSYCLAMWDSPEREKTFKEYITKEWESNKNNVFDGKTIESIYEEMKDSL